MKQRKDDLFTKALRTAESTHTRKESRLRPYINMNSERTQDLNAKAKL